MVREDAEVCGGEGLFCEGEEEGVLEDAAGEGDGREACGIAQCFADGDEQAGEAGVEGVGEAVGRVTVFASERGETARGEAVEKLLRGKAERFRRC